MKLSISKNCIVSILVLLSWLLGVGASPVIAIDAIQRERYQHVFPLTIQAADARFEDGRLYISVVSGNQASPGFSLRRSGASQEDQAIELLGSTLLGGSAWDSTNAVAVDSTGAVYIAGETPSQDFIQKAGFGNEIAKQMDGFIVKLAPGGTDIEYAALLGGSSIDSISAIEVENGIAYITGVTLSGTFPGGYAPAGESDVWAAAITPDGAGLIYSVRFGGIDQDISTGLAVQNGIVTLTGVTWSIDFPIAAAGKTGDMFVVQLNSLGEIENAAVFGGSDVDSGFGIDWKGQDIVVCGQTWSRNFVIQGLRGQDDGFILELDENLELKRGILVGGSGEDFLTSCAISGDGTILAVGQTGSSTIAGNPVSLKGPTDALVVRIDENGSLGYISLLGGSMTDSAKSISLSPDGKAWVVGDTSSSDLLTTDSALQKSLMGGTDAFLASYILEEIETGPAYSTFFGGSGDDFGRAVGVNPQGIIFMAGYTKSDDFPIGSTSINQTLNGSQDSYTAWFGLPGNYLVLPTKTPQPQVPTATPMPTLSESAISAAETSAVSRSPSAALQETQTEIIETSPTVPNRTKTPLATTSPISQETTALSIGGIDQPNAPLQTQMQGKGLVGNQGWIVGIGLVGFILLLLFGFRYLRKK